MVCMHARVSEKGQITVPKTLRERLDIRAGDELELTEQGGRLVVTKAPPADPVASVYGVLSTPAGTDELLRALRGAPDGV
jgi:AbrB family looped-hinge helix DNA binding protein